MAVVAAVFSWWNCTKVTSRKVWGWNSSCFIYVWTCCLHTVWKKEKKNPRRPNSQGTKRWAFLCVTFSYEFFAGCWPHEHGVCRLAEVNLIMISYNRSRRGRQGSDLQRLRQVPLWLRPARSSFAKKGRGTEEIHTTMNIIAADITNCMSDSRRWELQLWGQIDAVLLLHSGCYFFAICSKCSE